VKTVRSRGRSAGLALNLRQLPTLIKRKVVHPSKG
jgi:hypothetical protein